MNVEIYLGRFFQTAPFFDNCDFKELYWKYEKAVETNKKENENNSNTKRQVFSR